MITFATKQEALDFGYTETDISLMLADGQMKITGDPPPIPRIRPANRYIVTEFRRVRVTAVAWAENQEGAIKQFLDGNAQRYVEEVVDSDGLSAEIPS